MQPNNPWGRSRELRQPLAIENDEPDETRDGSEAPSHLTRGEPAPRDGKAVSPRRVDHQHTWTLSVTVESEDRSVEAFIFIQQYTLSDLFL
jgi:hypothetical protein